MISIKEIALSLIVRAAIQVSSNKAGPMGRRITGHFETTTVRHFVPGKQVAISRT